MTDPEPTIDLDDEPTETGQDTPTEPETLGRRAWRWFRQRLVVTDDDREDARMW